jgi:hypothetical protein
VGAPTFLLRVMGGSHLLLVMPPNNAIITAARNRKTLLSIKLADHGYSFGFAPYPDDFQRAQLESQGWVLPPKRRPLAEAAV